MAVAESAVSASERDASASHAQRSGKLGLGMLTAYGAGSGVQDTVNFGLNNLVLFYLTIVCGLSGSAAGVALAVALVVDAFIDPLFGSLSDNSRSRHGRRHPWMVLSAVPLGLSVVLLFSVPTFLTGNALFAYALVTVLAVRIGLSGFNVPYIALGAELSDDYAERSTIVASRVLFSVLAGTVATILAYGVFLKGPGGQMHRAGYAPFAISSALMVILAAGVSTLGTLSARGRLHGAPASDGAAMGRFVSEVVEVFRNPSFRILFFACLILFVSLGVGTSLTLHANTYFWRLRSQDILVITLAYTAGVLMGVFIAGFMSRVLEKRTIALIGIGLIGLAQLAPAPLKLMGLAPSGVVVPLLLIASAISGIGASAALIGFQSMMADAADEHEHLFGSRREGLYFAGISLSAKASSGVGVLIAGLVLDLIGFPHGTVGGVAVSAVPPDAILKLGLIYGPGAALITSVAIAMLLQYRRGKEDHDVVRDALAKRRGA